MKSTRFWKTLPIIVGNQFELNSSFNMDWWRERTVQNQAFTDIATIFLSIGLRLAHKTPCLSSQRLPREVFKKGHKSLITSIRCRLHIWTAMASGKGRRSTYVSSATEWPATYRLLESGNTKYERTGLPLAPPLEVLRNSNRASSRVVSWPSGRCPISISPLFTPLLTTKYSPCFPSRTFHIHKVRSKTLITPQVEL